MKKVIQKKKEVIEMDKDTVKKWFMDEEASNYSHMIVMCNKKTEKHYPVYVSYDENLFEQMDKLKNIANQEIIEVFTYSYSIDKQLSNEFNIYPNENHIQNIRMEMFFEDINLKALDTINKVNDLKSNKLNKNIADIYEKQILIGYIKLTNYYSKFLMSGVSAHYIIWNIIFKNFGVITYNVENLNFNFDVTAHFNNKNKNIIHLHLSALSYSYFKLKKANLIFEKINQDDLNILRKVVN